jgi:hypothetical protein
MAPHCLSDEKIFSQLRALDIYPTTIPTSLDVLLSFIESNSDTLEKLTIRDRYLHQTEASDVIVDR